MIAPRSITKREGPAELAVECVRLNAAQFAVRDGVGRLLD